MARSTPSLTADLSGLFVDGEERRVSPAQGVGDLKVIGMRGRHRFADGIARPRVLRDGTRGAEAVNEAGSDWGGAEPATAATAARDCMR